MDLDGNGRIDFDGMLSLFVYKLNKYKHKLKSNVLYSILYQNLLTEFCKMMLAKFHDIEKQERKLKRAFKVSFHTSFLWGPIPMYEKPIRDLDNHFPLMFLIFVHSRTSRCWHTKDRVNEYINKFTCAPIQWVNNTCSVMYPLPRALI